MKKGKNIVKKLMPKPIFNFLINIKKTVVNFVDNLIIRSQFKKNVQNLNRIRERYQQGQVINIVYFVEHSSMWKLDSLYNRFSKDQNFNQLILIVPIQKDGLEEMKKNMEQSYLDLREKGYNVIKSYDFETEEYVDVERQLKPDIIFFTRPYRGAIDKRYFITNYLDYLTCYVHYGIGMSTYDEVIFNQLLPNIVWTYFLESNLHFDNFKRYSKNNGYNGFVTGFPGVDALKYQKRTEDGPWKIKDKEYLRIIWAPHHSIFEESALKYSNFLEYYDVIWKLSQKYREELQISFKPHPLLKVNLYKHPDWGKEKTDAYYQKWKEGENTQLDEGSYVDLFNSSDALIHDSGSFIAEYLYCGKPVLFLEKENVKDYFNEFGKQAFYCHYKAQNESDLVDFIENVVINGEDYMLDKRDRFYHDVLISGDDFTAAEKIYNYIIDRLGN